MKKDPLFFCKNGIIIAKKNVFFLLQKKRHFKTKHYFIASKMSEKMAEKSFFYPYFDLPLFYQFNKKQEIIVMMKSRVIISEVITSTLLTFLLFITFDVLIQGYSDYHSWVFSIIIGGGVIYFLLLKHFSIQGR